MTKGTWVCVNCGTAACAQGRRVCASPSDDVRWVGEEPGRPTGPEECVECGAAIERGKPIWRQIIGWEQKRVKGGTNHVALRKPTGKVMCEPCMVLARSDGPVIPGQRTIYDDLN